MFDAFPNELYYDVSVVLPLISQNTYNNIICGTSENVCVFTLLNGEMITFPYRVYYLDEYNVLPTSLTFDQKMIYHCIFSRSYDGFVREKHIKLILKENFPDWVIPYILKVSDEYVVEILKSVYDELKNREIKNIKTFCRVNLQSFLYSHDRMISYWNEFYREQCYHYKDYVGKKLFLEVFGYTKSMQKERVSNYKEMRL